MPGAERQTKPVYSYILSYMKHGGSVSLNFQLSGYCQVAKGNHSVRTADVSAPPKIPGQVEQAASLCRSRRRLHTAVVSTKVVARTVISRSVTSLPLVQ